MCTSSSLQNSSAILNVLQRADLQDFEDICVRKGLKKVQHLEHVTPDLLQQELGMYRY